MRLLEHAYTDVVEEFKYDSDNEQYNMEYLQWRRESDSKLVFRFSENNLESFYVQGDAAAKQDAGLAERSALMHCAQAVGAALLLFFLTAMAGESLLNAILRLFGIDMHMDFLLITMKGSQWAVVAARAVLMLLKYLLPACLLIRLGKLPRRIFAPVSAGSIPEFSAGVGAGMVIAGIFALISQKEGIELAQSIILYKDTAAVVAYGIFNTLIASAAAELFLRGTVLMLLRQFGDPFAVAATALIAFLFPNEMPDRICELLIGLAAGYLMIRAGSLPKCIALRVVYTGLSYARLVAVYNNMGRKLMLWEYSLLLISLGTLALAFFVMVRRHSLPMSNRRIILSNGQKFSAFMQTVTVLPWAAVSVLLMLVQMFF